MYIIYYLRHKPSHYLYLCIHYLRCRQWVFWYHKLVFTLCTSATFTLTSNVSPDNSTQTDLKWNKRIKRRAVTPPRLLMELKWHEYDWVDNETGTWSLRMTLNACLPACLPRWTRVSTSDDARREAGTRASGGGLRGGTGGETLQRGGQEKYRQRRRRRRRRKDYKED